MSADIQSNTTRTPRPICLMTSLPESEQQVINEMLKLLPVIEIASNTGADVAHAELNIKGFVDGRGLACPMPLFKSQSRPTRCTDWRIIIRYRYRPKLTSRYHGFLSPEQTSEQRPLFAIRCERSHPAATIWWHTSTAFRYNIPLHHYQN